MREGSGRTRGGSGARGRPTPEGGAGQPLRRGGAGPRTGEPGGPRSSQVWGGEPSEPAATGWRRVGCEGAWGPSLGAGRWNVIDWEEGAARPPSPSPRAPYPTPPPPRKPDCGPARPHPVVAGGAGAVAPIVSFLPSSSRQNAPPTPTAPSPFPWLGATSAAPFPSSPPAMPTQPWKEEKLGVKGSLTLISSSVAVLWPSVDA